MNIKIVVCIVFCLIFYFMPIDSSDFDREKTSQKLLEQSLNWYKASETTKSDVKKLIYLQRCSTYLKALRLFERDYEIEKRMKIDFASFIQKVEKNEASLISKLDKGSTVPSFK